MTGGQGSCEHKTAILSNLERCTIHRIYNICTYLVKDGHVSADKTISDNLSNSSSLILNMCDAFQMVTEYDGDGHFDGLSFGATSVWRYCWE